MRSPSPHARAVLQALLVTFLWSTSWVLIKFGLRDVPALTFAGLRYGIASACLPPRVARSAPWPALRRLAGRGWLGLALLGLLFYAVTQGAQFLGLAFLPAVTVSPLLNFTTVVVALLGMALAALGVLLVQGWPGPDVRCTMTDLTQPERFALWTSAIIQACLPARRTSP